MTVKIKNKYNETAVKCPYCGCKVFYLLRNVYDPFLYPDKKTDELVCVYCDTGKRIYTDLE